MRGGVGKVLGVTMEMNQVLLIEHDLSIWKNSSPTGCVHKIAAGESYDELLQHDNKIRI